ncbi:MAG: hypothetical protein IRZ16_15080 [Myxococcaceae bacterium]|nr:hypothetical protein [Myxococcaceae bacterium]
MTPARHRLVRSFAAALAAALVFSPLTVLAENEALPAPLAPHAEGLHEPLQRPDGEPLPRPAIAAGEITTRRFRLVYTARAEGTARELSTRIESIRDDFQKVLGRDWPGTTEIRIGIGRKEMEALALPGGNPPAWAEALAYPGYNIVLLDGLSLFKPDGGVTLRHELSHVALGQLSAHWPRWFQEGMAMYLTGDRFSIAQYTAMFRAVTNQRLFLFDSLADGWPDHPAEVEVAYAQSVIFVTWLVDEYGPDKMGAFIDLVHSGTPFDTAYAVAFHSTLAVDEDAWRKTLPNRYSWTPIVTGGGALWGLMSVLMVAAWVRRRRDRARKMEALAAEEAAEMAERLARALQTLPPANTGREDFDEAGYPREFDGTARDEPSDDAVDTSNDDGFAKDSSSDGFDSDADAVTNAEDREPAAEEPDAGSSADDPSALDKPRRILH